MNKRNIFSELIEGFGDLAAAREDKRTPCMRRVDSKQIRAGIYVIAPRQNLQIFQR